MSSPANSTGAELGLRLHPLNRGFHWEPVRGPFRRVSAAQADSYNRAGYFLVPGALDAATVDAVLTEIDPIEARVEAVLRSRPGGKQFIARANEITFSTHLVKHSARLREFVASAVFRDLGHDLLGPNVRLYWDQAVYKKPGTQQPFPWHQDNGYAYLEPQQYLTCWVALSDTDEKSGCPWVAPGLHHRGTLEHRLGDLGFVCLDEAPADAVPVPAHAGDIVVFSSLTPHTTGPHSGLHVRKAYIVQLAPDGAHVHPVDGAAPIPADDPERQFPILVDGRPPALG